MFNFEKKIVAFVDIRPLQINFTALFCKESNFFNTKNKRSATSATHIEYSGNGLKQSKAYVCKHVMYVLILREILTALKSL